jgi:hypothetical protein
MKLFGSILAVLGLSLAVAACMPAPPPTVSKESLLSSSGFRTITLKTPGQIAAFKALPAQQLTQKTYKGKNVWVYPDQAVCGCLYIGNQSAYSAYIKSARANMIKEAISANDSDNPYSPTSFNNMLDADWANDPEAYGLYEDW